MGKKDNKVKDGADAEPDKHASTPPSTRRSDRARFDLISVVARVNMRELGNGPHSQLRPAGILTPPCSGAKAGGMQKPPAGRPITMHVQPRATMASRYHVHVAGPHRRQCEVT
jgi:hypothetical protein